MKQIKFFVEVAREAIVNWLNSNVFKNAASMAYYAIFSIPGLLIIIIWVAGLFFGEEAINGQITEEISEALGTEGAKIIQDLITNSLIDKDDSLMKIIGLFALIYGATTLFFQLQKNLNELWNIKPAPKKALVLFVLSRANSLGMILVIGFLMIVTMVLSSFISAFNGYITRYLGFETYQLMQSVNFSVGFIFTMAVFSFMFKILPDIHIPWAPIWRGAFVTTILFTLGKFLLSYYFATFKPTSAFGAVGTLVLIMMWINYSCTLIFLGAEFTKVYTLKKGYYIAPTRFAKWNRTEIQ